MLRDRLQSPVRFLKKNYPKWQFQQKNSINELSISVNADRLNLLPEMYPFPSAMKYAISLLLFEFRCAGA